MALTNTFGVTYATVEPYIAGVTLSSTSRPTATQVTALVGVCASDVCVELRRHGVTPSDVDATGEPDLHEWCAVTIALGTAATVLQSTPGRGGAGQGVVNYWSTYKDRLARLRSGAILGELLTARRLGWDGWTAHVDNDYDDSPEVTSEEPGFTARDDL